MSYINYFYQTEHIFDEETEIYKVLSTYDIKDDNKKLSNYKFVKSESESLVQVSDVVSGLFGKFFIYVNTNEHMVFFILNLHFLIYKEKI